jgi:uncharacterized protein (DUF302 family)
MGVQPRSAKKSEGVVIPSQFSPRQRAQKAGDYMREQVMILSGGSVVEYNEMMSGDVDFYLRKFEANIKAQK